MIRKEQSQMMKGISIIVIILSHVCAGKGNAAAVNALRILLPSSVAIFLFSTGYGIEFQYRSIGEQYLTGFVKNKIIKKLMIPYISSLIVYSVINHLTNIHVDYPSYAGSTYMPNAWYMDFIIGAYFVMFLIYKFIGEYGIHFRIALTVFASFAYCAVCVVIGLPSTWYVNIFSLILGQIACGVDLALSRKKMILLTVLFLELFNALTFGLIDFPLSGTIGAIGSSIFTSLFLVFLTANNRVKSKVLVWFGKNSLYLYLIHSAIILPLNLFVKSTAVELILIFSISIGVTQLIGTSKTLIRTINTQGNCKR